MVFTLPPVAILIYKSPLIHWTIFRIASLIFSWRKPAHVSPPWACCLNIPLLRRLPPDAVTRSGAFFCGHNKLWLAQILELVQCNLPDAHDANEAFDFLPGAAGGVNPDTRHLIPSIFLPFSNLIESHSITSPLAESSDKWRRVFESERPAASAISASNFSPCFFKYCRISFIWLTFI